jgi:hypothetical protein
VEGGIAEGGIAWCGIFLQYHPTIVFILLPLYISLYHMCLLSCLNYYLYIFRYIILYANIFDNSAISLVNVDVVFFSNFS